MNTRPSHRFSRRAALGATAAIGIHGFTGASLHGALARAGTSQGPGSSPVDGSRAFLDLMGHVSERMTELEVPAVGVALIANGVRHTCALGYIDVERSELVDAQTMFRISPLSELVTGSAIAALIDDGVLELDTPVRAYLPSFTVRDAGATREVTIRHLVAHSAGWQRTLATTPDERDDALSRYVESMATLPQLAPPGARFSYSTPGVILAGRLAAMLSGVPFEEAARELALLPLSMDQSSFLASDMDGLLVARGHTRHGGRVTTLDPLDSPRVTAPVSGMFSNLNEILQFASFHAYDSTPPTYISAAVRNEIHSTLGTGGSAGAVLVDSMGMSWMISEFAGRQISMRIGSDDGHSSMIAVIPSERFAVVVLTNADYAQDLAMEIALLAMRLYIGIEAPVRTLLTRPAAELQRLTGTYWLPDGPQLHVSRNGDSLRLDVLVGGSPMADVSGELAFVSPLTAIVETGGSARYVDFVLDHEGRVAWLRYFGELALRQ